MTIAEAQDCCRYWQNRLRLQDWDVQVELVRYWDMPDALGDIVTDHERREAYMRLLEDYDRDERRWPQPMEHTIVHELLHIVLDPFWSHDTKTQMEQAINLLAGALIAD